MNNSIVTFDHNLPAHLRDEQDGLSAYWDEVGLSSFARIKMKGNSLQAFIGPELVAQSQPLQPMTVVMLRPSKVGRTFYHGIYVEGSKEAPDCYSNDNITPAADAKDKQCTRCDLCPQNLPGSGINGESRACRYRQSIAVWTPGEGDSTWDTIFQVNLSSTAIFGDKPNPDGYMGLNALVNWFRRQKLDPSKAWIQLAVDPYSEHKRIVMKPEGYINDPEEYQQVRKLIESDELDRVLRLGVLDTEQAEQMNAEGFGQMPDHLQTPAAHAPVRNTESVNTGQETVDPFTGEILYYDTPITDDIPTYWQNTETKTVVMLQPGTNLPVDTQGIEEVTLADYQQYEARLAEERRRAEAQRRAEEQRLAEERRQSEAQARRAAEANRQVNGAIAGRTRNRTSVIERQNTSGDVQERGVRTRSRNAANTLQNTSTTQDNTVRTRSGRNESILQDAVSHQDEPTQTRTRNTAADASAVLGRRRHAAPTQTPATGATRTRGAAVASAPTAQHSAAVPPPAQQRVSRRASVVKAPEAEETFSNIPENLRAAQQQAAEAPDDEQPKKRGKDGVLTPEMAAALDAALLKNNE
ncbi:hypothetical protein [Xenorhabdus innexi]|uniref:Uncharacterized protein n=1 Tax=Xenorhabdus innexi TaxID=290109 RepID=A0A1N6MWX7_9GAMM|nr:hypothetical protein [Xenorhabdus innexi]PHM35977.1 hypothetical protein Xinn_02047 [Xenorhabdus innexi]SIP73277.1 hypothetical protein XIS1_1790083 [Xenorhabdus innexi]